MPIKRQVIEQMLNFPDYRTLGAAQEMSPKKCMKDGYGHYHVMSTHSMGRHYTIPTSLVDIIRPHQILATFFNFLETLLKVVIQLPI